MTWSQALTDSAALPAQAIWRGVLRPPASGLYHIGVEHTAGPADSVRLDVAGRTLDARGVRPVVDRRALPLHPERRRPRSRGSDPATLEPAGRCAGGRSVGRRSADHPDDACSPRAGDALA